MHGLQEICLYKVFGQADKRKRSGQCGQAGRRRPGPAEPSERSSGLGAHGLFLAYCSAALRWSHFLDMSVNRERMERMAAAAKAASARAGGAALGMAVWRLYLSSARTQEPKEGI